MRNQELPEDALVIEIRRGDHGMAQIVDEEMMREEPDREERLKWLFYRAYEEFERHEFRAIEQDVMRGRN
jgi:hypothetical protein